MPIVDRGENLGRPRIASRASRDYPLHVSGMESPVVEQGEVPEAASTPNQITSVAQRSNQRAGG